ncbi:aminodeoxychorismate synthase component I [Thermodesulfobacteriota bacterium]
MNNITEITGIITGIKTRIIKLDQPFIDIASRFSHEPGTTVLMSGGDLDCSRYNILAIRPWLVFSGKGTRMSIKSGDRGIILEGSPFDILRTILDSFRIDDENLPASIGTGLFGYLSYDLKDYLEKLPRTSIDDLDLPVMFFAAPSIILVHDKKERTSSICITERNNDPGISLDEGIEIIGSKNKINRVTSVSGNKFKRDINSNFTRETYKTAIDSIREYIASGHVYQVNMSQRFEAEFSGNPFNLFEKLFQENPAPFFAYINAEDHHVVSTSPERFLNLKENHIETRPIKGTKPRGKTEEEDRTFRSILENSKKDDAELSMIVDLMRNDIGKVCEASSVKVKDHKRLETYENVYHLVSIVEGTLRDDCDEVDLLKATFPGGSITGCPKIRAMEIIDELEPNRRHVYTGSIGYISFHKSMDLSIAIRTATIHNNRIYFSVGGGVVYDSDPLDEYNETLHKGKTIMETLTGSGTRKDPEAVAWINGSIRPFSDGAVNLSDLGFQYGYGFFETIRVDSGNIFFLEDHIDRFNRAWDDLFMDKVPDLTWDEIIMQVIRANGLEQGVAAVKIMATYGDRTDQPCNHNLFVTARPYTHRFEEKKEKGLRLGVYPEPRQSPLAKHKTLNYLYYFMAGKWAKENRFDEAVILNPDKSISEVNSANILILRNNTVIQPESPHVLRGVMEKNICEFLENNGYSIETDRIFIKDLNASDRIIVTNSLIGAAPAFSIDNQEFKSSAEICEKINNALLKS